MIRQRLIAQGLIVPESARRSRPMSADELEAIGYPIAARAKRLHEMFA